MLAFQESNKYAGIITIPILRKLLDNDNIKLSATLVSSLSISAKSKRKKTNQPEHNQTAVRIVVYGLKRDRHDIGNFLSDGGLYLQQPFEIECEMGMEYCNPHYLVRPGSRMPRLSQSSTFLIPEAPTSASERVLSEANKNRFMQIFDLANHDSIYSQILPSCRLNTTLKE